MTEEQKKINVYYDRKTIGCYGTDAEGNSWATFEIVGAGKPSMWATCEICEKKIRGGWQKNGGTYYCASHINYGERIVLTVEQTQRAVAVLQEFVKNNKPSSDDRGDYLYCMFCSFADYCSDPNEVEHDEHCPMLVAKRLLQELGLEV